MKPPAFWQKGGWQADVLEPIGAFVGFLARRRQARTRPFDPGVPVICVGNLTVGGQGKTPVVLDLARRLIAKGRKPAILSRGYKGRLSSLRVDPTLHGAGDVGDEPLLLAAVAPTYIDPDRTASAKRAIADGADCLLMDDGFQNPGLKKHLSLIVIDGPSGFGNGYVMPAGPLRENPRDGLQRADAVILIGEDRLGLRGRLAALRPVLLAKLMPGALDPQGPLVAFAGIGRPEKFFDSLRELNVPLAATLPFDDHHPYSAADWAQLQAVAKQQGARLITTAKDAVRLTPQQRAEVLVLPVAIGWQDPDALTTLIEGVL